jgi:hypothetical protein
LQEKIREIRERNENIEKALREYFIPQNEAIQN